MEVMAPMRDIMNNAQKIDSEPSRDNRDQEQTSDDQSTLAGKAKEVFHSAVDKTAEIVHQVKAKITGSEERERGSEAPIENREIKKQVGATGATVGESARKEDDFNYLMEDSRKEVEEDIFARTERQTREQVKDEQFWRKSNEQAMNFSPTDEPNAEPAQKVAS